MFGRKYSTGKATYDDGLVVTDEMVANFVRAHTHWWDRFDYHFICDVAQIAFLMLSGNVKVPNKKHWYF